MRNVLLGCAALSVLSACAPVTTASRGPVEGGQSGGSGWYDRDGAYAGGGQYSGDDRWADGSTARADADLATAVDAAANAAYSADVAAYEEWLRAREETAAAATSPFGTSSPSIASRELADPQTYLGPTPTAFVLLDKAAEARNRTFCGGFVRLDTPGRLAEYGPYAAMSVPTRWLAKSADVTFEQAGTCEQLLAQYDYTRADALRAALAAKPATASSMTGAGPWIVEMFPDGSALVVSGSQLNGAALGTFASSWLASANAQLRDQTVTDDDEEAEGCSIAMESQTRRSLAETMCNGLVQTVGGTVGGGVVIRVVGGIQDLFCPEDSKAWYCRARIRPGD